MIASSFVLLALQIPYHTESCINIDADATETGPYCHATPERTLAKCTSSSCQITITLPRFVAYVLRHHICVTVRGPPIIGHCPPDHGDQPECIGLTGDTGREVATDEKRYVSATSVVPLWFSEVTRPAQRFTQKFILPRPINYRLCVLIMVLLICPVPARASPTSPVLQIRPRQR